MPRSSQLAEGAGTQQLVSVAQAWNIQGQGRRGRVAGLIGQRRYTAYCTSTYLFLAFTPPRRCFPSSPSLNEFPSWPIRGSGRLGRAMALEQRTSSLCWPAVFGPAASRRAVRVSERRSENAWTGGRIDFPNPSGVQKERRCSAESADGSCPSAVPSRVPEYFAHAEKKTVSRTPPPTQVWWTPPPPPPPPPLRCTTQRASSRNL